MLIQHIISSLTLNYHNCRSNRKNFNFQQFFAILIFCVFIFLLLLRGGSHIGTLKLWSKKLGGKFEFSSILIKVIFEFSTFWASSFEVQSNTRSNFCKTLIWILYGKFKSTILHKDNAVLLSLIKILHHIKVKRNKYPFPTTKLCKALTADVWHNFPP